MYSSIACRLLVGLLSSAPAWAACPLIDLSWKASLIQQSSQWDEFGAKGARLVHEHGNLPGWELATNLRCAAWNFGASWQQLAGNRAYDGQTSDGVLLQSQTDWSQQHMRFDIHYDVIPNWAAGVRVTESAMQRILQGNAQAVGYPERYRWTMLSVGLRTMMPAGNGTLSASAWTGKAVKSEMNLTLPSTDPASLPLGAISQTEIGLEWTLTSVHQIQLSVAGAWRRTRVATGAIAPIYQFGHVIGYAYQPEIDFHEIPVTFGVRVPF
jgi:hypothetical protein